MRTRKTNPAARDVPFKRVRLQCCGYKRCPEAVLYDDGRLVLADPDGPELQVIDLQPEQVDKLRELLGSSPTVPRRGRK